LRPELSIKLFVVDTIPLITLAAANSLDYLLYVENAEIVIPDAVLYEATHDASRLGAADILGWVKANRLRVEVAPTNTYLIFVRTLGEPESGRGRSRREGRGRGH
jgi:hypothetical protein